MPFVQQYTFGYLFHRNKAQKYKDKVKHVSHPNWQKQKTT